MRGLFLKPAIVTPRSVRSCSGPFSLADRLPGPFKWSCEVTAGRDGGTAAEFCQVCGEEVMQRMLVHESHPPPFLKWLSCPNITTSSGSIGCHKLEVESSLHALLNRKGFEASITVNNSKDISQCAISPRLWNGFPLLVKIQCVCVCAATLPPSAFPSTHVSHTQEQQKKLRAISIQ